MSKLTKQNVGDIDYTMVGCTLTGVCPSAAADFVKVVTLSDGDVLSDGMMVACTFANGNTAGEAPGTLTIYSSDQVNYYSDSELTQPFTLAPSGCYTIEYTGTGNAYTYSSFPVIQVGNVSGSLCAANGTLSGSTAWGAGDTVLLLYTGGKFLAINVAIDTVASDNMHAVTSDAVSKSLSYSTTEQKTGGVWIDGKPIYSNVVQVTETVGTSSFSWAGVSPSIGAIIDTCIKSYATYKDNGIATTFPIRFFNTAGFMGVESAINNGSYIVLEYTKTTDQAVHLMSTREFVEPMPREVVRDDRAFTRSDESLDKDDSAEESDDK